MIRGVRSDLPTGTVTFLFTDVEGSTKLLQGLGPEAYADVLMEHRRLIREAAAAHGGVEVDTQGDAFFIAFATAPAALAAAAEARDGLASTPIRVRAGLHSGAPYVTDEGYVGADVHRAARIAACGHGGQILVSQATAALTDADSLRDLGEHRLKDLSKPERIFQLGQDDFPPLKSLHRTNLPIPSTPFLGREKELAEVCRLLVDDNIRLLTLTGAGGTGKTRLAAQAAGLLADRYPDGVWWIPLAPLRDPELVLTTAGQSLGTKNGLADHVGDKSMLVLFDNFEQVVDAAEDVAQLLPSCPGLDLLVTSREPLHVSAEQEYAVPPLDHEEGVGFFLARARAVVPDFEPDENVSSICRRLDDLPLALELAAARVKALSPVQILDRLEQRLPLLTGGPRDLPERQRTLRATIDWSFELLSSRDQGVFAGLAAFNGGSTLEAAEHVANADLDTLQSLVDKSLLRHIRDRYWMLETIREYASDRLRESGDDRPVRQRHAQHFLALAEEADSHLRGDPADWLERLELEHDNFRAAMDWLEDTGDTQHALRLSGSLARFWWQGGHTAEGSRRLERHLDGDASRTAARAKALDGAATLLIVPGEAKRAAARGEEALALYRELGDEWGEAHAFFILGGIAGEFGDLERARDVFEESAQRFRALGDAHYALLAKFNLAWTCRVRGDRSARALLEETLDEARAAANKRITAITLGDLAPLLCEEGRCREAVEMLREAYDLAQELGQRTLLAELMSNLASVLATAERPEEAARVLAKADVLNEEIAPEKRVYTAQQDEETLKTIRSHLDETTLAQASEDGRALTSDEAVALAVAALG